MERAEIAGQLTFRLDEHDAVDVEKAARATRRDSDLAVPKPIDGPCPQKTARVWLGRELALNALEQRHDQSSLGIAQRGGSSCITPPAV